LYYLEKGATGTEHDFMCSDVLALGGQGDVGEVFCLQESLKVVLDCVVVVIPLEAQLLSPIALVHFGLLLSVLQHKKQTIQQRAMIIMIEKAE